MSTPRHRAMPTLGGLQLWSDYLVLHDWRIQRHASSGDYRLLDKRNVRRAEGSFAQCRQQLERLHQGRQLPALAERVIVLLHGLGRTRYSLSGLAAHLKSRTAATVINLSYASTRLEIGQHAESLASVVRHLPDVKQIDFVAHSMGSLVVRHWIADLRNSSQHDELKRIRRIVMLCPPNRGAVLASSIRNFRAFQILAGPSGQQIARWESLPEQLATPTCQFGIIAGGTGKSRGYNPLIPGDNDLVVTVEETKLAGARDFVIVPCWHTTIMNDARVREYVLRFLEQGQFRSATERTPIRD